MQITAAFPGLSLLKKTTAPSGKCGRILGRGYLFGGIYRYQLFRPIFGHAGHRLTGYAILPIQLIDPRMSNNIFFTSKDVIPLFHT